MSNHPRSFQADVTVPLAAVVDDPELALEVVRETLQPDTLDLPVRWAHVSELHDPEPYLLGDELLLIAGVNLPGEQREVDRYVQGLRAAGITALGFGVTPPMHEQLPPTLRRACVRHGLPLLVVPVGTPFLAISRAVSVAISAASRGEQRRTDEAREALIRAASGGVTEVVRGVTRRLSGWGALVDANGAPVTGHGIPVPFPAELDTLLARLRSGTGTRSATTELADGSFVMAQPVFPQATASHVLVVGRRSRFGKSDRAIIGVGAATLGLLTHAGSDTAALASAATALLLRRAEPPGALAALLPASEYRVVAGVGQGHGPNEAEAGYDWLRERLDTPLIEVTDGPRFTAITNADPGGLAELHAHGWLAVAGAPVPASELASATQEVDNLLQRARSLGRPVIASGSGLDSVVPPEAGRVFASRTLAPVLRLARSSELVETLRAWLAHHGGWEPTAAALGVHRNSVRHRIAQIERALDADLADPETRMELWFALRWTT